MSEFHWDALENRWTLQAPHRGQSREALRPSGADASPCPLCEGQEGLIAPEIDAVRPKGEANQPGWVSRVIPCPHPLLSVEKGFQANREGLFEQFSGVGAHELLVDCPEHNRSLADLPIDHLCHWLRLIRNRFHDLRGDFRLRYFALVKNHGPLSGARTAHSCTHLLGLPVPPPVLEQRLIQARQYYQQHERCYLCDSLQQELHQQDRIIIDDPNYVLWAPYASAAPFEMALAPRAHQHDFTRIKDEKLPHLARVLKQALQRLRLALEDPSWQLVLHTAPPPHRRPGKPHLWHSLHEDTHWEFRIRPCMAPAGAFETIFGGRINSVAPDEAARYLRELQL